MRTKQTMLGKVTVTTSERTSPIPAAMRWLKLAFSHTDLSGYVLVSAQLRMRRDGTEFPTATRTFRQKSENSL